MVKPLATACGASMSFSGLCRRCGTGFKGRSDRLYCSDRCRYLDWQAKKHEAAPCRYCGMPADGIDHIPPASARTRLAALGIADRYPFVEVQCCGECNSLLGARPLWTVAKRKAFIKKALRRRYKKYLRIPAWSDGELAKLGPILQRTVINNLAWKEMIEDRIKW